MGEETRWRAAQHTLASLIESIFAKGKMINPLLSIPGMHIRVFRLDWLHVVDQGVGADCMGNALYMLRDKMPGGNKEAKQKALWTQVEAWYKREDIEDRLQNLTQGMIKAQKKGPKLRASGAQVRALIPFARAKAEELFGDAVPVEAAAKQCIISLHECYKTLSRDVIAARETLKDQARKFALQYVSLSAAFADSASKQWIVKPKLHLFMHLAEEGANPSKFWCYRDEDFGGHVAKLCRRRGGLLRSATFSSNYLLRFRLLFGVPRIQ